MDWSEIQIEVGSEDADGAADIAQMASSGGIFIEDYSRLEQDIKESAHEELIDGELLAKDRTKATIHIYLSPGEDPSKTTSFLAERFGAAGISYAAKTTVCRNEDWENNWKKYFLPFPVGEKLYIRPVWTDDYDAGGRIVLSIDPGLSFGTGTHETTRLCLEAIESRAGSGAFESFLDVGCGSGILSIAALLLGAQTAVAVDIDAFAVKTARENGRANDFDEPRYKVLEGDLVDKVSGKFDVVAANIVADTVIRLSNDVKKFISPGGVFIASGIIDKRESDVLAAFDVSGLDVLNRYERSGWLCFATTKRN